ncbi:VOC family protein [Nocardia camponoti]|uniref:Glyoxalase-like domain-containing protein n=1 Tax=Nocardia camponoti TaxID=1616106 RepID=A0A917QC82_9NOCA|nr:VOC family protein [Nocardia camponoti]GGK42754.1 hypothetical protein GCM10011591_13030 [Nocardia camponoti]
MTEPFQVAGLALECDDPETLARFYLGLLGGRVLWNDPASVGIRIPSGLTVALQYVPDYEAPTWPQAASVQLNLAADADLALCEQHALAIGAKPAPAQPDPRWRVLLDPAGHPFSITTRVVVG